MGVCVNNAHTPFGDYMEHTNPDVINYIKSKITSEETSTSGDIETTYKASFDNGMVIEGKSMRPIEGYNQEEAAKAAYDKAISKIYDGVAVALSKL